MSAHPNTRPESKKVQEKSFNEVIRLILPEETVMELDAIKSSRKNPENYAIFIEDKDEVLTISKIKKKKFRSLIISLLFLLVLIAYMISPHLTDLRPIFNLLLDAFP